LLIITPSRSTADSGCHGGADLEEYRAHSGLADHPAIERHGEFLFIPINAGDEANMAVEDVSAMVVLDLHHLAPDAAVVAKLIDSVLRG
jgi:hypothetical protein